MAKKIKSSKPKRPAPAKKKPFHKKPGGGKPASKPRDKNAIIYGLAERHGRAWEVKSITRKDNHVYQLIDAKNHDLMEGDIIAVIPSGEGRGRFQSVVFKEKIGHQDDPGIFHILATLSLELPHAFPAEVLAAADAGSVPTLGQRVDLRSIPLVTIDDADAKDFDDAVYAEKNGAGFRLIVAIADVAHYVPAGSALDEEAFLRGNSVYFPGHVIPMLPEALSNNLCSLRPHEPRAALVCEMQVDANGNIKSWQFYRALMQSAARLTYVQMQKAADGEFDETTETLREAVITPLYACYHALLKSRVARGTLDLEVPEYKIKFDDHGRANGIIPRTRLDSHRLIEEMMIAANVCAARELNKRNIPALYRTHDAPDPVKLEFARGILDSMGFKLVKGAPQPRDFMGILERAKGHAEAPLINQTILRTQSQAIYSPLHAGHFGLALTHYTHFTSPIRRYADLVVHRALIAALGMGTESQTQRSALEDIAVHINITERRAMDAERQVMDRYRAAMLSGREGEIFTARINSVTRFGAFITLPDTGTDGIIPMRHLARDYLIWEEGKPYLTNRSGKVIYRLGQSLQAKLLEVSPISGGLVFEAVTEHQSSTKPSNSNTNSNPEKPSGKRKFRRAQRPR